MIEVHSSQSLRDFHPWMYLELMVPVQSQSCFKTSSLSLGNSLVLFKYRSTSNILYKTFACVLCSSDIQLVLPNSLFYVTPILSPVAVCSLSFLQHTHAPPKCNRQCLSPVQLVQWMCIWFPSPLKPLLHGGGGQLPCLSGVLDRTPLISGSTFGETSIFAIRLQQKLTTIEQQNQL